MQSCAIRLDLARGADTETFVEDFAVGRSCRLESGRGYIDIYIYAGFKYRRRANLRSIGFKEGAKRPAK
jgi:hypothetical protein